jgi:hypothetical protein
MNPRTQIKDAIIDGCSFESDKQIQAFEDVAMTATMQAVKSYDNLVDWETYRRV